MILLNNTTGILSTLFDNDDEKMFKEAKQFRTNEKIVQDLKEERKGFWPKDLESFAKGEIVESKTQTYGKLITSYKSLVEFLSALTDQPKNIEETAQQISAQSDPSIKESKQEKPGV